MNPEDLDLRPPSASGRRDHDLGLVSRYVSHLAVLAAAGWLVWLLYLYRDVGFVWEAYVVRSFLGRVGSWSEIGRLASECFLWTSHLISESDHALFFAVPFAALLKVHGVTYLGARLVPAFFVPATILLAAWGGRRFFGPVTAAGAAVFLATSPMFLLGGIFVSSLSANRFFALLASLATLWFVTREQPRWWDGIPVTAALYLATIHYTPSRLLVLFCLATIAVFSVAKVRRAGSAGMLRLAILGAGVAAVVAVQHAHGRLGGYFAGGGESFLSLARNPGWLHEMTGVEVGDGPAPWPVIWQAGVRLVRRTTPELLRMLVPGARFPTADEIVYTSPPNMPLLSLWTVPLVLVGLWYAFASVRDPRSFLLLLWLFGSMPPALLCTYVAAYRVDHLLLPLAYLFGTGTERVGARLARWLGGRGAAVLGLAGCVAAAALVPFHFRWPGNVVARDLSVAVGELLENERGHVVAAMTLPEVHQIWLDIRALEIQARTPHRTVRGMGPDLAAGSGGVFDDAIREAATRPGGGETILVVFVPSEPDDPNVRRLTRRLGGKIRRGRILDFPTTEVRINLRSALRRMAQAGESQ